MPTFKLSLIMLLPVHDVRCLVGSAGRLSYQPGGDIASPLARQFWPAQKVLADEILKNRRNSFWKYKTA